MKQVRTTVTLEECSTHPTVVEATFNLEMGEFGWYVTDVAAIHRIDWNVGDKISVTVTEAVKSDKEATNLLIEHLKLLDDQVKDALSDKIHNSIYDYAA